RADYPLASFLAQWIFIFYIYLWKSRSGIDPAEVSEAEGFVVVLRRVWLGKVVAEKIISNEEGVHATEIAPHEAVALLGPEFLQRLQTRPIMREIAKLRKAECLRVVGDYPRHRGRDYRVVLDDHHTGPIVGDLLPDVVIVAVDIDRQEIDLFRHPGL